jgi:hypothetical protein
MGLSGKFTDKKIEETPGPFDYFIYEPSRHRPKTTD